MTSPTYRIAAIPGDGVGPDVLAAGRAVLDAAGVADGFSIAWTDLRRRRRGASTRTGVAVRPEDVATCAAADAVLLGAVGGPKWDDPTVGGPARAGAVRPPRRRSACSPTSVR